MSSGANAVKRCLVGLALALAATPAFADGDPWTQGVADVDQKRANEIFAEANTLFAQQAYGPALEKYEAALAIWDHPVIRFNMAVTLIRNDRFLDAAEALETAQKFGKAPFSPALWAQLQDYQTLVNAKVGVIEATCTQDKGTVTLDGKEWFSCPGTRKQRVLVGDHTLGGEHSVLLARSQHVSVTPGATASAKVELMSIDQAVRYERRFSRWIPWTVIGGSVAGEALGLLTLMVAASSLNAYDQAVASQCAINGCELDHPQTPEERSVAEALNGQREDAHRQNTIANAVLLVSTAGLVTGIVLAVLNRPHAIAVDVAPTQGGASASVGWHF
jgi:tetratricopeptide (TPR) repeat protein